VYKFNANTAVAAVLSLSSMLVVGPEALAEQGPKSFSGNAHWYGHPFHGRRTASGQVFDMNKLTAAHPSLPFGTKVKVTHKRTGKSCVVEITDRCPRLSQRVIDLSKGAFQEIGASGGIAAVDCIVMAQE
jgi:rare lipoprotein A